jgi:hypothetical protein
VDRNQTTTQKILLFKTIMGFGRQQQQGKKKNAQQVAG